MIYVVTRTYQQAKNLANVIGLQRNAWSFVFDHYYLMGITTPTVILWGRYQDRPDWPEVEEQLHVRQATTLDLAAIDSVPRDMIRDLYARLDQAQGRALPEYQPSPGYIQTVNNGGY